MMLLCLMHPSLRSQKNNRSWIHKRSSFLPNHRSSSFLCRDHLQRLQNRAHGCFLHPYPIYGDENASFLTWTRHSCTVASRYVELIVHDVLFLEILTCSR